MVKFRTNPTTGATTPVGLSPEAKKIYDTYFAASALPGKGGCMSSNKTEPVQPYHSFVREKMAALNTQQKALEKFGVELEQVSEIEPLAIYGYVYDKNEGAFLTNDGIYTNVYEVTWLFFSDTQIYSYTYRMDVLCNDVQETCREYFYKDVTSVTTIDEMVETTDVSSVKSGCMSSPQETTTVDRRYKSFLRVVVPNDRFYCSVFPEDNKDFVILSDGG